ncbi:substrate-binding domain-containing protein [Agaribacter flavus]|uniref:Substrate-binding domain-containing protein n=1 Tax=Agaribacter flavus TaxID=1902781 RepID=A0ABV7FST6_9ALTE
MALLKRPKMRSKNLHAVWHRLIASLNMLVIVTILCAPAASVANVVINTDLNAERSKKLQIVMFIHADKGFPFYDSVVDYSKAVSKAFKAKLDLYYVPRSVRTRFDIVEYSTNIVDKYDTKPNLIVAPLWLRAEHDFIRAIEDRQIDLLTFNYQIPDSLLEELGKPREKYKHWLAHISPNDVQAGYELTKYLLAEARRKKSCNDKDCRYNIFAVRGFEYAAVTKQRHEGLVRAVNKDAKANLLNVVNGDWKRKITADLMPTILNRHDDIDIFWASSDVMAYGILDGLDMEQPSYYERLAIGAIDWSPPTIAYIEQGKMQVSLGGHFMEAGWAIQLYLSLLAGYDFEPILGTMIHTQLSPLNRDNVKEIGRFLKQPKWQDRVFYQWQDSAKKGQFGLAAKAEIFDHIHATEN